MNQRTFVECGLPVEGPVGGLKCRKGKGHVLNRSMCRTAEADILAGLISERDRYRKALEEIAAGREEYVCTQIAREALAPEGE